MKDNIDIRTPNGLYVSIDYLGFTVTENLTVEKILNIFGLDLMEFEDCLKGSHGYKARMRHYTQPISILYDGSENMGINVEITGSAIKYFMSCYNSKFPSVVVPFGVEGIEVNSFEFSMLSYLLKDILDIGHLTRFDIAIDDRGCQYFTMAELSRIFNLGLYTSKFKTFKEINKKSKREVLGSTIYLGSRQSDIMFRLYDKKAEQSNKTDKIIDYEWTRWEIELKGTRARAVALLLISGKTIADVSIGVLSHYLRIIKRDNERDTRCSSDEKWLLFLNDIQTIKICQPVREKTLEDKEKWIEKQVAPTLSALYKIYGSIDFFYDLVDMGAYRIGAELQNIIQKESEKFLHDN